jgi:chromosome segregation ATPase
LVLNERILRHHFARVLLQEGDRLLTEAQQVGKVTPIPFTLTTDKVSRSRSGLLKELTQQQIENRGWKILAQHLIDKLNEAAAENVYLQQQLDVANADIEVLAESGAMLQERAHQLESACELLRSDNHNMGLYLYEKETELERAEASLQEAKSDNFLLQSHLDTKELECMQLDHLCGELQAKLLLTDAAFTSLRDSIGGQDYE